MVTAKRVFETVLYADDLARSERFYRDVLGLEVIQSSDLFTTFKCGDAVLLIFDPEKSAATGRSVPSHGARGPGHIAFPARDDELEAWRRHLRNHDGTVRGTTN